MKYGPVPSGNVFVDDEADGTVTGRGGALLMWLVGRLVPDATTPPTTPPAASRTATSTSNLRRRSRRFASRNSASSSSEERVDGSERVVIASARERLHHRDQFLAPVAVPPSEFDQLLHL